MRSPHDDGPGPFLTPSETRRFLGISPRTLDRWRNKGIVTPHHYTANGHARYARADVERVREAGKPRRSRPGEADAA